MKNLILLNRLGFNPDLTTRQSRVDSVSIASRYRVLATLLLCLTLFVGSGNVWGYTGTFTNYTNATLIDGYYIICPSTSASNTNYCAGTDVSSSRITGKSLTSKTNPADAYVWIIENTASGWTFNNYGTSTKYIRQKGTSSGQGMEVNTTIGYFTLAGYNSSSPVGYKFTSADQNSNNQLKWNNSSKWFANYANAYSTSMAPVCLYRDNTKYRAKTTQPATGSFTASATSATWDGTKKHLSWMASGATVTLTAAPPSGKEVNAWTVTKASGGTVTVTSTGTNTATFSMPADQVTVTVTWKDATPAYTITAQSNNNTYGTVNLLGNAITGSPNSGYRYASPAYTVSSGTATVSQVGDVFTVTPSSDCTITINFEAIPTHDIHFDTGGLVAIADATGIQEGATYDITQTPAASLSGDCEYNTFVGWTTASSIADASVKPSIVTSITMSTADVTLYAVYSKTEGGGGGEPTAYSVGDVGNYVLAALNKNDSKWYAIPTGPTVTGGKIAGVEITVDETEGKVKYVTTSNATGYTWTIAKQGNYYTISDGTKYLYHSNGGASSTDIAYGSSTDYPWSITNDNGLVFAGVVASTSIVGGRGLLYQDNYSSNPQVLNKFGGYSLSNKDGAGYSRIQVLPIGGGGTTTYSMDAGCCENKVELSVGSLSHCSSMSIDNTDLATCSSTDADRQVTVTVTPDAGYEMTSEARLTFTPTDGDPDPTATYVLGPTTVGATYQFVYEFKKDDNGAGTFGATCTAKTYTISLNDQTPTTAASPSSITATFDSNTGLTGTVVTTLPTKTGYTFGGYYTDTGGGGVQLINSDGEIVANAGTGSYTDASKNWKYADDLTIYAKWTEKSRQNYRTTCGVEITVSGSVWLTSYANVAVYTTNSPNNLITVTCTDFGSATRLGVKYIHNGDAVTKTSSPFRLCYYGFPGKTDYNKADGDGTAGGYDYINLSSDAKTAIASGQTFAIEYKPAADEYDQEDTYTIRLAALDGSTDKGHVDFTVHGRALPEQFVIASKVGDQWYALPNTILDNNRAIEPIKITVDNTTTPTRATDVPNTTAYQGTGRYASGTNRYGIRLTDPSGHWLQVSSSSGTNYVWVSGTGNSTCQDWNLSSTDFGAYTLTVPSSGAGDKKMGIKSGNMGYYASPDDPSQQIYLLPADFYTEAEAQILKWKANSVIVMYTGTETSSTTKVGSNSASSAQTLSSQKLTHGIYELTTGQALTSNAGQTLALTFGSTKKEYDIPLIISGSTTASANGGDVVILSGGTFTAAATKYSFRNVYVYGGGKLAIPSGTSLGTSDIILRAGGISTNGSGGSATYEYVYPQFSLIGTLTNSSGKFRYEYVTDYSHWYHLCLPFDATLSTITYPQEYYGNNVTKDNKGSWVIKRYDGATRADGDYDAWVDIESESATEVTAGHGYIYWGAPKKVTISGDKQRQAWGIQRMTMTKAAPAATTAEADNKTVSGLGAYSGTGQVNDQGWNLVGNPYMVNLSGLSSTSLQTGKLVHEEVGGQWTGRWESNDDGMRYITQPSEHFDTYEAVKVTSATVTLTAGKAFFVQLAGDATALQFEASKRVNMPSLYRQNSVDVETGIVMSNSTYNDKVEFWIKDGKTAEYEVNADYPKTMNGTNFNIYGVHSHGNLSWVAIGPEIAEGSMPIGYQVPGEGDYTLSLLEPAASELESLLVTDHGVEPNVTVDLVEQDYVFHVNQAETNDARFTVSIELKDETPEDPENPGTGVDENKDIERPIKFIYQDKLYILRNGVIYDATGKRVREVNK